MLEKIRDFIERLVEWLKSLFRGTVEPPKPPGPYFRTPHIQRDGEIARNEKGNMICEIMKPKADSFVRKGRRVVVYRWAFPVNGGTARETVYHIIDRKGLIDIKDFTKPEE